MSVMRLSSTPILSLKPVINVAIRQNQSPVRLGLSRVRLAIACNPFLIIQQLTVRKAHICCCLHKQFCRNITRVQPVELCSLTMSSHRMSVSVCIYNIYLQIFNVFESDCSRCKSDCNCLQNGCTNSFSACFQLGGTFIKHSVGFYLFLVEMI